MVTLGKNQEEPGRRVVNLEKFGRSGRAGIGPEAGHGQSNFTGGEGGAQAILQVVRTQRPNLCK